MREAGAAVGGRRGRRGGPQQLAGDRTTSPSTVSPTVSPTTVSPTVSPTTSPSTVSPTVSPSTVSPTVSPTTSPSTVSPTVSPTTVSPTVSLPQAMQVENFLQLVSLVAERDAALLSGEEAALLAALAAASRGAQSLFVRLLQRKGPWFAVAALDYREVRPFQVLAGCTERGQAGTGLLGDVSTLCAA